MPDDEICCCRRAELLGKTAQGRAVLAARSAMTPEEEAQFVLGAAKKVGGAVAAGLAKVDKAVAATVDKHLGKVGGASDCEWVTTSGAQGTTHICIDHEGNIEKGPKGMKGKNKDDVLGADHEGGKAAQEKAKAKKDAKDAKKADDEKTGKAAYATVTRYVKNANNILSVIQSPTAGVIGKVAGKYAAGKLGFVKRVSSGLEGKIRKRYGEPGGSAIILGGLVVTKAAGPLLPPPAGTIVGLTPGSHLLGALPLIAAAEGVRGLSKLGKLLGPKAVGAVNAMRSLGRRLRGHGKAEVAMSADDLWELSLLAAALFAADGEDHGGELPPPDEIQKEGAAYMKELKQQMSDGLASDKKSLEEFVDAVKKCHEGKAEHSDAGDEGPEDAPVYLDGLPTHPLAAVWSLKAHGLPDDFVASFLAGAERVHG